MVDTIGTFLFLLWHVSNVCPILPQLIQVYVDLVVTIAAIGLATILASNVVSRTL